MLRCVIESERLLFSLTFVYLLIAPAIHHKIYIPSRASPVCLFRWRTCRVFVIDSYRSFSRCLHWGETRRVYSEKKVFPHFLSPRQVKNIIYWALSDEKKGARLIEKRFLISLALFRLSAISAKNFIDYVDVVHNPTIVVCLLNYAYLFTILFVFHFPVRCHFASPVAVRCSILFTNEASRNSLVTWYVHCCGLSWPARRRRFYRWSQRKELNGRAGRRGPPSSSDPQTTQTFLWK